MTAINLSKPQVFAKVLLGFAMLHAGIGHLTFARSEFLAQVPPWVPMNPDVVVILSGVVEVLFGLLMIFKRREAFKVGFLLAAFFIAVLPGNISQYQLRIDAFGLNTDKARLIRLYFQPVLVLWALWCTGAITYLLSKRKLKAKAAQTN